MRLKYADRSSKRPVATDPPVRGIATNACGFYARCAQRLFRLRIAAAARYRHVSLVIPSRRRHMAGACSRRHRSGCAVYALPGAERRHGRIV